MNNKKLSIAKQYLSEAFADLEAAIIDKVNSTKQIAVANSGIDKNNQDAINNFHNEINSLQKALAELGIENEKLRNARSEAGEIVNQVKIDLAQIKRIINQN
jgi:hypothetical protein